VHELGIATEVHRTARAAIAAHGAGRLERVRMAVGELSAVEPDLLEHAWEAVVAGGVDEGSILEVDWRPARQICTRCGEVPERGVGTWLRLCPRCEEPMRVEGGDELDVLEVSFVTGEG